MRVGYFINQYPATTHSFIRREIRALEAIGVSTFRYALRSGIHKSVDPEDDIEEKQTKFIHRLESGKYYHVALGLYFSSQNLLAWPFEKQSE